MLWYQLLVGDLNEEKPTGDVWKDELRQKGMPEPLLRLLISCFERAAHRTADAQVIVEALTPYATPESSPKPEPAVRPGRSTTQAQPPPAPPPMPSGKLPPVHQNVRALESRLKSLQDEMAAIESGSHASLQHARLEFERHPDMQGWGFGDLIKKMIGELSNAGNAGRSNADWCGFEPNLPLSVMIPVIEAARLNFRLVAEAQQVSKQLLADQEADFHNVVAKLLADRADAEFPIAHWMTVVKEIRKRGYRFASSDQDFLRRAEAIYKEPSYWREVESAGTWELYEQYASRYPHSPRAPTARQRQGELLRKLVIKNPFDATIRQKYLDVRSEAQAVQDGVENPVSMPWLFFILIVSADVAAGKALSLAPFLAGFPILAEGCGTSLIILLYGMTLFWLKAKTERTALRPTYNVVGLFRRESDEFYGGSIGSVVFGLMFGSLFAWLSSFQLGWVFALISGVALLMVTIGFASGAGDDIPSPRFFIFPFAQILNLGSCVLMSTWLGFSRIESAGTCVLATVVAHLYVKTTFESSSKDARKTLGPLPWWFGGGEKAARERFPL